MVVARAGWHVNQSLDIMMRLVQIPIRGTCPDGGSATPDGRIPNPHISAGAMGGIVKLRTLSGLPIVAPQVVDRLLERTAPT